MTKTKFLSFFVIFLIGSMLVSSIFAVLPLVKADNNSQNTIGVGLNGVDNNQGTYCYLNGFDVFATDTSLLFYSGNGSYLVKDYSNFIVLPSVGYDMAYANYKTRIIDYNSTTVLSVTVADYGGYYDYSLAVFASLINTQSFTNKTLFSSQSIDGGSFSFSATYGKESDIVLSLVNGQFFALVSGVLGNNGGYSFAYQTALVLLSVSGGSVVGTWNNVSYPTVYTGYNATQLLGGESFWFQSQTSLNVIYIVTKNIDGNVFQIFKVNCVAPSLTLIGYSNQDYNTFVYFVNYNYDTINGNSYYDVLFSYPASSDSTKMDVELIRFNDTYYKTPVNLVITDTNSISNYMRPYGCIPPIWINNINSLTDGNYIFLYGGYLYRIYGANVTLSGLATVSPSLTLNSVPDGIINIPLFSYNIGLGYTTYFYCSFWI